tara:strand:+ start:727 stop:957 length:231 start_codon:yes stop_codon:yes gene_type:complete
MINELIIANGITKLLAIANLSFETFVAPIFHARKPKPVENNPRNSNANKLYVLSIPMFVELIIENIEVINTAPKNI